MKEKIYVQEETERQEVRTELIKDNELDPSAYKKQKE